MRSSRDPVKIVIPGGTGQVGTILARAFHRDGHEVVALGRSAVEAPWRVIRWDPERLGDWTREIDGADAVINMAGRSVNCRYNAKNRQEIMHSRVGSTRIVGEAIARATRPPATWLQASTATIYSHRYDAPNDDESGILGGADADAPDTWRFRIDVCTAWERAIDEAKVPGTRKVKLRSAVILSPDRGGIFDTILRLARRGLGGTAGDGKQYVSWIHDEDFVRAVYWLLDRGEMAGSVNLASPNPLPNRDFMAALRHAWGMPIGLPASRWMIELGAVFMRTETELLLKSRRVVPSRLLGHGFTFRFPDWPDAARDLCIRWRAQRRGRPVGWAESIPVSTKSPNLLETVVADGRPLLQLTAFALLFSGCFALFLSIRREFLPHDIAFLGMTPDQLCAIAECRVVAFMFHDRVAFGGVLIAIAILYFWLAAMPLAEGKAWAWWTIVISGGVGFLSFLSYLGRGYLDTWHGVGSVALAPIFLTGLLRSRILLRSAASARAGLVLRGLRGRQRLGRLVLLATGLGMVLAGATILTVGMTRVFVPQDLEFMRVSIAELDAANPRLVPLIAHDRAGFGGGLLSAGLVVAACALFASPSRSLWQALAGAGAAGFGAAIGVHPAVGYTDWFHLTPAIAGGLLFLIGLALAVPDRAGGSTRLR